ncbi:uncharacterized protein LOC134264804 [Saccostrea cucullata]|uniref:uncharacterized protein LOC134264804 n=1 Tax=Saccostrea cuccullata TaxID=36930 RepID=UPI002ED11B0C
MMLRTTQRLRYDLTRQWLRPSLLKHRPATRWEIKELANVSQTYTPKSTEDLKEYLEKCMKEEKIPIFLSKKNVHETILKDEGLKDVNLAFIDVQHLKHEETVDHPLLRTAALGVSSTMESVGQPLLRTAALDVTSTADMEETMKKLQEIVGANPVFRIEEFKNWAATQRSCVISCKPTTKEEMSRVIKAAAELKVGIRCAGQRHSWAPISPDNEQICINVDQMKSDYDDGSKIRIASREKREIDVMTGVTTGELKEFQLDNKINLKTNVILDVVHLVSVVVTGCHGVGNDTRCISDYVVKLRAFDSNGVLRTYDLNNEPKEKSRALSASFGCFGIVYDVTLKMDEEIIVSTENSYGIMKNVFRANELEKIVKENWAVQMFWFPFNSYIPFKKYHPENDDIWVRTFNKTTREGHDLEGFFYYVLKAALDLETEEALKIVSPFLTNNPSFTPLFQRSAFCVIKNAAYRTGPIYQEIPHAVHFRKYIEKAEVYDLEFVFDYKGNFDKVLEIINVVVNSVQSYKNKDQYPLNVSLEMRFMAHSDAYLGTGVLGNPEYGGSGQVVCIEVLSLKGTPNWEEFSQDVGKKWMELGGVPHLAKQYDHIPNIWEHVRKEMKLPIESFKEQLKKSEADPNGMFLNSGMRKLFGMVE